MVKPDNPKPNQPHKGRKTMNKPAKKRGGRVKLPESEKTVATTINLKPDLHDWALANKKTVRAVLRSAMIADQEPK